MDYPTREEIQSLCTEQSFERGVNYYHQDRVQKLEIDGDEIRATVRGSSYYDVALDIVDDTVQSHCSCPYDYAGDCKHIVAVLLAVDDRDTETVNDTDAEPGETTDIEALVEQTTPKDLRAFLLDIIADDRDIRDRFVAFVGEDTGKSSRFCKEYAQRLIDEGNESQAIEVIEDGIHTVRSPRNLRWLAADLYRELLVPFAAGDTGRRHYREIADHLTARVYLRYRSQIRGRWTRRDRVVLFPPRYCEIPASSGPGRSTAVQSRRAT